MSKVRCNDCMKEFDEEEIVFDDGLNAECCPYCGGIGYLMDLEDKTEGVGNSMSLELRGYKKYQLEWMIEHGYSIMDLVQQLENLRFDLVDMEKEDGVPIEYNIVDIFNNWQDEIGFKESEIWACEDEWEDNEGTTLWCISNSMLNEKPYLNYGKHKDLVAICVSEYFSEDGEYVFYIEKDWLHEYVKSELGVEDVDYWLQNEYTSDESEPILLEGIRAGVVSGIYK